MFKPNTNNIKGWRGYHFFLRFDESNRRILEDGKRTPKNTRRREITPEEEARILSLRKQYITWGKMKLQKLYQNIHQKEISSWKIQYTIQKRNLYPNPAKNVRLQQKRKRNQAKKRITELKKQSFPGFLIALALMLLENK